MPSPARDFQEKRDFIRMKLSTPAVLITEDQSRLELTCHDLSSSGAQLKSSEPIKVGLHGELQIQSGGGYTSPLCAKISVVRCEADDDNNYRIGAKIEDYIS